MENGPFLDGLPIKNCNSMAMLNNQMVILRSPRETWQFSNPTRSGCNELCYQQRKQSGCCSTQTKTNSHCMPLPWKVTPSFYTKRVDVPKNGNMEGFSRIHDELMVWASGLETATPACEYEKRWKEWLQMALSNKRDAPVAIPGN